MKRVICFGNPYLPEDSLAIRLADNLQLQDFEFVKSFNPSDLLDGKFDFILDVAKGIEKITFINNPNKLNMRKLYTLHDFDLGFFLQLMSATGQMKSVNIIAVPDNYDLNKALSELEALMQTFKK